MSKVYYIDEQGNLYDADEYEYDSEQRRYVKKRDKLVEDIVQRILKELVDNYEIEIDLNTGKGRIRKVK